MSLSKLSKLPPEVLSSVLNNQAMPLGHRLHLRLLCNRWADIIEDGLKKETSLVVCDEKAEFYTLIRNPDLILKSSNQTDEFTRPLSRLFPSLTKLTIDFGIPTSWNKLPSLLANLDSINLTTVSLYSSLCVYKKFNSIAIARALTALSGFTALTLVGFQFSNRLLPHLETVLSRLEKFGSFDNYCDLASLLSSSLSPRWTHLWLLSSDFKSLASSLLVELSSNSLHLHFLICDATIWQSISQMHRLSSLTLRFMGFPHLDSSYFSHLGTFTRLTQVKLYPLSYRAPLALPSKSPPLSTIKHLSLEIDFGNSPVDYQTFCQTIGAWFPALAQLTIITSEAILPAIQASIGELPFSVKMLDLNSVDISYPDW